MATILQVRPPSATEPVSGPAPLVVGGPTTLVGRTLGSYTVIKELGHGGMGIVYLAEHALIGRKAAIKVLNPDIATDQEVVSRFFTEARAVNDIRHPNIVEVTDFGQFGPYYCIVMEYLEGETLAARLTRIRAFDEPATVRIMKQCTSALGAAHEQGLVHRDLKPENIFLRAHPDYPDFVKVLDFGIAKLLGTDSSVGHHTKTGSVLGTPSYMSPEQCLGEAALDIRSDVYSLGIVIYQMLTGQLPFTGDTLGRLIVCHVNEAPVPPSVINPAISRTMNDVILRALQKKPKDRFQSAREMRDALERVLPPSSRAPTPAFGVNIGSGPHALAPRPQPLAAPRMARALAPAPARLTPPTEIRPPAPRDQMPASNAELRDRLIGIVQGRISGQTIELPDLPGATIRCIDLDRQGRLGFVEAASILGEVPALRSSIMRLANSAAFPSLMPATTLEMAVGRLGAQGLTVALVELAAHEALEGRHPRVREGLRRIWPHALGAALTTADLCTCLPCGVDGGSAYLAGLLSQVGRAAVGTLLVDIGLQMLRGDRRSTIPDAVFWAVIDACHSQAGAAVARYWDLAPVVAMAIEGARAWNPRDVYALSNLVRMADIMMNRIGLTFGASANGTELERSFGEGRALLRIDEITVRRLTHGFKERMAVLSTIRG
ncbi:MAG TPA: protein kinase [Polyangia bacterium]|nr:protein kinase [Polyangia bacterium]